MPSVEIDGAVELRKAMYKFTPNLASHMEDEMINALAPIVRRARGFIPVEAPLSTWQIYSVRDIGKFPRYNALDIARGIYADTTPTKPNRKGWAYAARIVNSSAVGSIIETAGRKNPNGRKQGPIVAYAVKTGPNTQEFGGYRRDTGKKYSNSANPNAGRQFIQALGPLTNADTRLKIKGTTVGYKSKGRGSRKFKGRLIFKAWAQDQGRAAGAVNSAIDKAIREFNSNTFNLFKTRKAS